MAQRIRTALLGFGLAGSVFHAPSLASLKAFSLDVIVTSDPLRQAAAKLAHPGAAVLDREQWASEGPGEVIDLVVVATPPATPTCGAPWCTAWPTGAGTPTISARCP